jgi:hypothetical protein
MMRLFSSRRESITAGLRARAARFEQQYGRAPSQRELARLAQASNFTTRSAKTGALDVAQAHAGWADTLARTLGVSLARCAWTAPTPRGRSARTWRSSNKALTCNFSVELRGSEPLTPSMRTRSMPSAYVAHCS